MTQRALDSARLHYWNELSRACFEAIKHGDAEHQAWLREALDKFFQQECATREPVDD